MIIEITVNELQKLNGAELEKISDGGMEFRFPVNARSLDMESIQYRLLAKFL